MRHDQTYLVKLERWLRVFAWFYLVGFLLSLVDYIPAIYKSIAHKNQPGNFEPLAPTLSLPIHVAGYIFLIIIPLGLFFLLQGLSKAIRYLMALMMDIKRKAAKQGKAVGCR